ncbi:MAG: hypothetical protein LIP01_02365 [Tannerellaceae bacterium]|nr:hypothetical protein [Tannerellaceae bacterium]
METGELHGNLSDISYKIINNPAQMYLMPVIENDVLLTPHYNYTSYPSGYFSPWINDPDISENTTDSPWLPATTRETLIRGDELAYGYCIENHNQSPLKSTSTMLLIKAIFTPEVWLNGDGSPGAPNSDGTFYRIAQYNTKKRIIRLFPGLL